MLGYFFGPRRGGVPSVLDVVDLQPGDAVLVSAFGLLTTTTVTSATGEPVDAHCPAAPGSGVDPV